MTIQKFL